MNSIKPYMLFKSMVDLKHVLYSTLYTYIADRECVYKYLMLTLESVFQVQDTVKKIPSNKFLLNQFGKTDRVF